MCVSDSARLFVAALALRDRPLELVVDFPEVRPEVYASEHRPVAFEVA